MANLNSIVLIALSIFVQQHKCANKPEIDFPIKDNLPENQFGNYMIAGFRALINGNNNNDGVNDEKEKQALLVSSLENIYHEIQDISDDTEHAGELNLLKSALSDLSVLFDKIDFMRKTVMDYESRNLSATDSAWYNFIQNTRNLFQGPVNNLLTIYSKIVPRNTEREGDFVDYLNDVSVINLVSRHMRDYKRICDKNKSQQQILKMLFKSLRIAEKRVIYILGYSLKKLAEIEKGDFDKEKELIVNKLGEKRLRALKIFKEAMSAASREVWRCDPKEYVEDVTFTRLNKVFQKYVINDSEMDHVKHCGKTCSNFDGAKPTECVSKDEDQYYDPITDYEEFSICTQQRLCNGFLYECEDYFVDFSQLWICPSFLNSTRRYEFMQHGEISKWYGTKNVRQYGSKGSKKDCKRHITYDFREFGGSWKDAWRHCEICLCTCDDCFDFNSERKLNFKPQVADPGYVVTGVKLVKIGRVLNLQIEQGKVHQGGWIDTETIHWKKLDEARTVLDTRFITWNTFNQILLGVSEVPKDNVIVGLKFSEARNEKIPMLAIKTLSVPFDYKTGKLTFDGVYYHEPDQGKENLIEREFDPLPDYRSSPISDEDKVDLKNAHVPTESILSSIPQPESKKIIKFTTSDFRRDVGQNMIPFLDIQHVIVRPATPITGVGFYHKNRPGFGGFIGLKVLTYDHSPYVEKI